MVTALACTILWTRLTTVLAWSLTGITMFAGCGLAAVAYARPQWLEGRVPGTPMQIGLVVLMLLMGMAIQWKLTARRVPKERPHSDASERPTHDD